MSVEAKLKHLIINTNKFFSAVSDYSLQLAKYSHLIANEKTVYLCHKHSLMPERCKKLSIPQEVFPILPPTFGGFFHAWNLLSKYISLCDVNAIIWTFEGREHSFCVCHKIFNKKLWLGKKLVRIRGQDQTVKKGIINRLVYTKYTDKIVLVANIIKEKIPFKLLDRQSITFYYCADYYNKISNFNLEYYSATSKSSLPTTFLWGENIPPINFAKPTFLVVGRYDPIKGHQELLEAFANLDLNTTEIQLVFIGKSENISATDLFNFAFDLFGTEKAQTNNRYYVKGKAINLYILDEYFKHTPLFIQQSHFGIISSLGSEVICRVAVEFLQAGTPLISTNAGALPEVLNETPALLTKLGDKNSMQKAIIKAIDIIRNRSEMECWRKAAFDVGMQKFSLPLYADLLKQVKSLTPK